MKWCRMSQPSTVCWINIPQENYPSHLVSGLVHPSYKWTLPPLIPLITRVITHLRFVGWTSKYHDPRFATEAPLLPDGERWSCRISPPHAELRLHQPEVWRIRALQRMELSEVKRIPQELDGLFHGKFYFNMDDFGDTLIYGWFLSKKGGTKKQT